MARRFAVRSEVLSSRPAAQRAHRHGRVRRAENCRSGLLDGFSCKLRHDCESRDVRGSSLIRRHSEGRVALQVFHRAESLPEGDPDVLDGHVVLLIHPGVSAALADVPERRNRDCFVFRARRIETPGGKSAIRGCLGPGLRAFLERGRQSEGSPRGPCDGHSGRQLAVRHERGNIRIPGRTPPRVAGQMDIRAPAA